MNELMTLIQGLANALLRMEKKVDELLRLRLEQAGPLELNQQLQSLQSTGQVCPLCRRSVTLKSLYLDEDKYVQIRVCSCNPNV